MGPVVGGEEGEVNPGERGEGSEIRKEDGGRRAEDGGRKAGSREEGVVRLAGSPGRRWFDHGLCG